MQILIDACLALLASIGLWALGRMALDRFMRSAEQPMVWTVIRIEGNGDGLERSVHKALDVPHGPGVLLVDCGLTKAGRELANGLAERYTDVWLCSCEQTGTWLKEAKEWKKQKSTIR